MNDTEPETNTPTAPPLAPSLATEPARIAAFINQRRKTADHASNTEQPAVPYNFADFLTETNMTNFDDVFEMRAILECQAQILGSAFQYLMMEGDWKNLGQILRTQKSMRDTMELMNSFPSTAHDPRVSPPYRDNGQQQDATSMD